MCTKKREVIWGGRIMGADMRAQMGPAKTLGRQPAPLIALRLKRRQFAWKATVGQRSRPQRSVNA